MLSSDIKSVTKGYIMRTNKVLQLLPRVLFNNLYGPRVIDTKNSIGYQLLGVTV